MILAVVELRRSLLVEHKAANYDSIASLEALERTLSQNGRLDHPDTIDLINELRRKSKGNVRT